MLFHDKPRAITVFEITFNVLILNSEVENSFSPSSSGNLMSSTGASKKMVSSKIGCLPSARARYIENEAEEDEDDFKFQSFDLWTQVRA
jgi:hypothetical protein